MKEWGEALHALLYYKKSVWELLPDRNTLTWTEGGCWILAQSLHQWFGPESSLWSIKNADGEIEHVVAKVGSCYFDGDGAFSKREFMERYKGKVEKPHFEPFKEEEAGHIWCPWDVLDRFVQELEAEFGPGPDIIKWSKGRSRAG